MTRWAEPTLADRIQHMPWLLTRRHRAGAVMSAPRSPIPPLPRLDPERWARVHRTGDSNPPVRRLYRTPDDGGPRAAIVILLAAAALASASLAWLAASAH